MEKTLALVTSQDRIAHLNLLANGEEVLQRQRRNYLPTIVACISLLTITGIVIYYELELKKVGSKIRIFI